MGRYWQKRYALLAELGAETDCEWFGGVTHTVKAIIAALAMIRANEVFCCSLATDLDSAVGVPMRPPRYTPAHT